jgi:hypothetical protein
MIESEVGRINRAELRQRRSQARRAPEPDDGDVRKPRTGLAPVGAKLLQPSVHAFGELGRASFEVFEDEHPDAPRLAIAGDRELQLALDVRGDLAEDLEQRRKLAGGPASKERDCGVEVVWDDDPTAGRSGERGSLPVDKPRDGRCRKPKGVEKAK